MRNDIKYNSWLIREGKQELPTPQQHELMAILMTFGESIDPHGYDGGDYNTAMKELLKLMGD